MGSVSARLAWSPDYYIARDPDDEKLCAVWEVPEQGSHQCVAGGFRNRDEAQRWIEYEERSRAKLPAASHRHG
jgi:hypothetical protein